MSSGIDDSIVVSGDRSLVLNMNTDADVPEFIGKTKEAVGSTTRLSVINLDGLAELRAIRRKYRFGVKPFDHIFSDCLLHNRPKGNRYLQL